MCEYVDSVVEIRQRLLTGDLRALYVLWLCGVYDDYVDPEELIEPPVPGGLAECVDSCEELLEFFGLDPLILLAASEGAPAAPAQEDQAEKLRSWIDGLETMEVKHLLQQLLSEDTAAAKARTLAAINQARASNAWPTAALKRTFSHLMERAETLRNEYEAAEKRQRDAAALRERQKRLASMVKDPAKWLEEANSLVEARGTDNYAAAADILFDLRDAIGGNEGIKITQRHAAHLIKKHPTLRTLKSALRKRGVLE